MQCTQIWQKCSRVLTKGVNYSVLFLKIRHVDEVITFSTEKCIMDPPQVVWRQAMLGLI